MENTTEEHPESSWIDIESFFGELSGRIEARSMEIVAAALAESTSERGVSHVLSYSKVDPSRLLKERIRLREKLSVVERG